MTLRVMGDPDQEAPIAGPFQEQNPNIKLEFIAVTGIDHEEVASKILSMIAAGQTIDIGYAATEALQLYAGQELSYPLDECVQRDSADMAEYFADVHPSLIQAMMYEGGLYELPFDFNAANMYTTRQLYQDAGLEHPLADWTKDDFESNATAITKKDDQRPHHGLWLWLDQPPVGQLDAVDLRQRRQPLQAGRGARR